MKRVIYQSREESERKQTVGGGEGVPEMDRRSVDESGGRHFCTQRERGAGEVHRSLLLEKLDVERT